MSHQEDRTLHTNGIEGLWGAFKHWLPQAGRYNLEEWLFNWIRDKKIKNIDPFWALAALVKADNSKKKWLPRQMKKLDGRDSVQFRG